SPRSQRSVLRLTGCSLACPWGKRRVDCLCVSVIVHPATRSRRWEREKAARLIGVADVDDAVPRLPILLHELKAAGADDRRDLLIGWRPCQACWHDEGDIVTRFG